MEMLDETLANLDAHVNLIDHATTNREYLVELACRVRRAFEGVRDMLELYSWVDSTPSSTYGATPLMSP